MELYFNAASLYEGLEESDVPAALTHLMDIYLQGVPLRHVASQPTSGAISTQNLSVTVVCLAGLTWLTSPASDGRFDSMARILFRTHQSHSHKFCTDT